MKQFYTILAILCCLTLLCACTPAAEPAASATATPTATPKPTPVPTPGIGVDVKVESVVKNIPYEPAGYAQMDCSRLEFTGIDENGLTVWNYETPWVPSGLKDGGHAAELGRNHGVLYIAQEHKILGISIADGEILFTNEDYGAQYGSASFTDQGVMFVQGSYTGPDCMILDANGNTLAKYDKLLENASEPCYLELRDSVLEIHYMIRDDVTAEPSHPFVCCLPVHGTDIIRSPYWKN